MAHSPTNILVLHAGALGDCVLALHFISAIRKTLGDSRVTIAARSSIVHWAKRHALIDEARSIEEIGTHYLYSPVGDLPEQTARFLRGFDRVVSFLGGRTEIVSKRLAQVLGREVLAIDPRPTTGLKTHIVGQWVDQVRSYDLDIDASSFAGIEIRERRALREQLCLRIGARKDRIVLCHPGSGGLAKCCPLEALERLVAAKRAQGWSAAWMIGPDELERFGSQYAQRLERTAPVLYEESVETAADLVCGADAFVGNDAGMTHVAALARVPTIALFGPTDPRIWTPLGRRCSVMHFPEPTEPIVEWVQGVVSRLDILQRNAAPDCNAA
ncbi:MAG: glycosyltransferase family 9 protein [Planctomycetota bacterium]